MNRNAYAAPPLGDDDTEPSSATDSHVRALPETLPDPEAQAHDHASSVPGASEQPAALLAPGTCVAGKYVICDVLGVGGLAVVYAAEQINLRRVVAFKLYPARGALASALLQRFEREAQLLARVHHENVVAVFDAGRMPDGSPYLVVQRLHGDSLATRLRASGPLPVTEAVDLTRQALHALIALGDAGITHRDVKPDNIVLDRQPDGGTVLKLVDFGIAKEAHDEASPAVDQMVGTPGYMPPEQVQGESIDARSDLYALGATLYEMLTGCTPHTGDTVEAVAMATLFGSISPLRELRADCPEGLAQIVTRALARDPSERFASAREMKSALDRWQADDGPRTSLAPELAHAEVEDVSRVPLRSGLRPRPRKRVRKRSLAGVACVGAFAFLATSKALHVYSPTVELPGQVTALALEASELAPFELALQARDHASALAAQTSTRATELLALIRGSAHEVLEVYRRSAPPWGGVLGGSAKE